MRRSSASCAAFATALIATLSLVSCAGIPVKRVDTVIHGAAAGDLSGELAEATVSTLLSQAELERVAREIFPLAAAEAGIAPAMGECRSDYALWLHEDEYTIGLDRYSAVLCVLKLRSKADGSVLATTIVSEETKLGLKSSGYVYAIVREALRSLRFAASEKAARVAAK